MYPDGLKYTREHEWARVEGDQCVIGITDYAQQELGDVVFVELPAIGAKIAQNETFGAVESVKAVSDLFAPVSGEVIEPNEALDDAPELVNAEPYGEGWMIRLRLDDPSQVDSLLDPSDYETLINELRS